MDKQIVKVNPSYDAEFGRGRKLTIKAGRVDTIPVDPRDHTGSAREMLDAIAPTAPQGEPVSKPLVYWANRLCSALESNVIDDELVNRCIEAIREHS